MRGKSMRMRFAMAVLAIIAVMATALGVIPASASVQDNIAEKVSAVADTSAKPVLHRMAKKGSFSCEGKSYSYGYFFYLQGSGQRIGYMVGSNNGRVAVRMWRPGGNSAYFAIGSLGTGAAFVAGPQYEYCSVRASGANGARLWARIPNVGTWEEDVRF